ncbi:MAG: hypothetical protein EBT86_03090 [Actinobacteria bacterium]|nr:hypothetical protein [Actinomycetota bacterium]NDG26529.1 hypothetical protein [Pseudomonadota bacterium]
MKNSKQLDEEYFKGNMEIKNVIEEHIQSGKKFFIGRIPGVEAQICYDFPRKSISQLHMFQLVHNAGINIQSMEDVRQYTLATMRAFQHCSLVAIWERQGLVYEKTGKAQEYLCQIAKKPEILAQALEPFYFLDRGEGNSWMECLRGKTVAIISPFSDTFQEQIQRGNIDKIFGPSAKWFSGTQFHFIKPPYTLAGNHEGKNWQDHFSEFKNRLTTFFKNLPEKPAAVLVSCGGYGMPVCDFLYSTLDQSPIYIGGALQLFFGVLGKRWETNSTIMKYVRQNPDAWVRPKESEKPPNSNVVERGCYW